MSPIGGENDDHCRFGVGKLYRGTDRIENARVELSATIATRQDTDMTLWLPEAKGELAAALPE